MERELRIALAVGSGWVLDAEGLERLRNVCISDWCRTDVDGWIRESAEPLQVSLSGGVPESYSAQVERFYVRSRQELAAKILQFPAGTRFVWAFRPGPNSRPDLVEEARRIEALVPGLR